MHGYVDSRTATLQEESNRIVLQAHVEPVDDIATERSRASFDVDGLKYYLNGGKKKYETK